MKPLDILKKGLKKLQACTEKRKNDILAKQKSMADLTPEEEHFLDHEANLVDEDRVIQELDDASDYERGVEMLNEKDKSIWQRLLELGGEAQKAITAAATIPSKKRKRMLPVV
jgi:hypothetical protein